MPFKQIDLVCFVATASPRELCIRFPVGQELCVSLPEVNNAYIGELLAQMLGQINTALQPLGPIFNIVDAVIAVFECVKAIPKCITELDPMPLINCLPGLASAINKLLNLIPQLSLPVMIVDMIDTIIMFLVYIKQQLVSLRARLEAILRATLKSERPGNFALAVLMDCINANFAVDIANLNAQAAPLNRLLGIIDFLLELTGLKKLLKQVGIDVMPCLGEVNLQHGDFLLDALIKILTMLRNLIPLPGQFSLTEAFPQGDC